MHFCILFALQGSYRYLGMWSPNFLKYMALPYKVVIDIKVCDPPRGWLSGWTAWDFEYALHCLRFETHWVQTTS
jgi:hypothetical protein